MCPRSVVWSWWSIVNHVGCALIQRLNKSRKGQTMRWIGIVACSFYSSRCWHIHSISKTQKRYLVDGWWGWEHCNAMWLLLCLQGTTHHLYLDQVILHEIPPSVQKLTTLQHTFASLRSLYLSVPIFHYLFFNPVSQNASNFYQCLLCWFSRKRDTGIPQHCNSQITSSEPGSLELAAPHRSPEAVASVPGRWPTRWPMPASKIATRYIGTHWNTKNDQLYHVF